MSSQGDMYPSCPVFCQATPAAFTNSLTNIIQLSSGAGKMAGADRFPAIQESDGKADVRAVKHCMSCRGDPGYTLPGVAFNQRCDYPQGIR